MTLQLMMKHHNTTFGNKMFVSLEDIWTNIDILTLHCDHDLECSNPFFFHKTLWVMISSDQVWLLKNQQFRRCNRKLYFDHMSPHCDHDLGDSEQFFHMILWLTTLHNHIKFGNKMFSSSEDII